MIRNLGQVAAIYIGSSAPRNTNLIWLDNTVVPFVFRAYDGSAWSEIATHKWVRAYVDGWLVTLPPRQLADDGDYMLINSNNVNYKITVKDFVKSAVGNPLDFKGIIRVSADFPNPSTLESGDMYVIITSPAGGTVTDPYSGKTFEDSEKIVWDEVTQSWESLGKIDITVDLTTSYSETEVTIHSSAGKETTIQGATDQLAGVMLPGQYSWLQALSNGSIVPGDPSPLTPLTPAHKHNYNDIINRLVSQQGTGESTIDPMSQKATTDALNLKFDKASVLQVSGAATNKVMSQKAVTDALKTLSDDFNNKLTNYLPLSGGTMTGSIIFPNRKGIFGTLTDGTSNIKIAVVNANNNVEIGNSNTPLMLVSNSTDLTHYRDNNTYKIWDKYNLTNPVRYALDASNYPTLLDSNGSSFSYIKAGPNGILPNTSVSLSSGGTGYCGTLGWSFKDGYFANVHTYKILIGPNDAFIDGQSGDSSHRGIGFYTSQNAACPVYVGSLCVSDGYANSAPNIPANGIYSTGVIKSAAGFTSNFRQTNLNLAKTGNDVLYISSFVVDSTGAPGTDSNTGKAINDGMFLTYFWQNDNAFQLAADIDGTGIAYRHYIPSTGNSTTGWKFLADTAWVVSKINSSTSNFLKKTGDTATGQIILDSNGIAFKANTWTNDLTPNKNYSGYLQVLDAYDASSAGGPTNYGTVLQVNSRNAHWANQLWFPGGAEASKNGLYYRHMAYNETTYGEWNRLLTNKDVNIIQTQSSSNPSTLPVNQIFYSEIKGVAGTPTVNGSLFSVQGDDEGIQLWASSSRTELYYRTKWTSFGNWIKLATTSDIDNYLPLTGGTLSGNLAINTVGSTTLVINNNDTNGSETFMRVLRKGTASAAIGFRDSLGAYIYNYNSNKYLFIDNDGYARVGTTSGSTRLALITDIPTVSGYLPLSGGTLTGALTMSSRRNNIVVDVVGGAGNNWDGGAGALSIQIPNDNGQTPLLLARRSGATINTTTLSERLLDIALLDTGTIFKVGMSGVNALELEVTSFTNKVGIGKLFGKQIATTDQIPSISISNSGSGNAVTAISASGHTLTVTKGATYLTSHQTIYNLTFQAGTFSAKTFDPNGAAATVNIPTNTSHLTNDSGFIASSALSGYATQSWCNSNFAPLTNFTLTSNYATIKGNGNEICIGNTSQSSASAYMLINCRVPTGCTYAPNAFYFRAGSAESWANIYAGNVYMSSNLVATQTWVNSQNFVKSTSTKKVTDIQPVDALPATQASGVLYLVFG